MHRKQVTYPHSNLFLLLIKISYQQKNSSYPEEFLIIKLDIKSGIGV